MAARDLDYGVEMARRAAHGFSVVAAAPETPS
jgi:hypothetical protein